MIQLVYFRKAPNFVNFICINFIAIKKGYIREDIMARREERGEKVRRKTKVRRRKRKASGSHAKRVSGQFTPGQFTPGQFTPGQFTPGRFTTR